MGKRDWFSISSGQPSVFRIKLMGHVIEARPSASGGESVLVNGAVVSKRAWWSSWGTNATHQFTLTDEQGVTHNAEVRIIDRTGGLGLKLRAVLAIDGLERAEMPQLSASHRPGCCPHCTYDLKGIEAINHEVRCPECGRHTAEELLNRSS